MKIMSLMPLSLMSFQARKTSVHLRNTVHIILVQDILDLKQFLDYLMFCLLHIYELLGTMQI